MFYASLSEKQISMPSIHSYAKVKLIAKALRTGRTGLCLKTLYSIFIHASFLIAY